MKASFPCQLVYASTLLGLILAACAPASVPAQSPTSSPLPTPTATSTITPTSPITPTPTLTPALPPLIAEYVSAHPDADDYTISVDAAGATHFSFNADWEPTPEARKTRIKNFCLPAPCFIGIGGGSSFAAGGEITGDFELVVRPDGETQVFAYFATLTNNGTHLDTSKWLVVPGKKNALNAWVYEDLGLPDKFTIDDLRRAFQAGKLTWWTMAHRAVEEYPQTYGQFNDPEYVDMLERWLKGELTEAEKQQNDFWLLFYGQTD